MSQSPNFTDHLTAAEKRALLAKLLQQKSQAQASPGPCRLLEGILAQVTARPEAIAVLGAAGTLTYQQLNQQADVLAQALSTLELPSEAIIATYLANPVAQVVALVALLKLGRVYAPLDPAMPLAWTRQIMQAVKPAAIISQSSQQSVLADSDAVILCWDQLPDGSSAPTMVQPPLSVTAKGDTAAYLVTADAALPEISLQAWTTHLQGVQRRLAFTSDDTLLLTAAPLQTSALWQYLLPLLVGGRLAIGPQPETSSVAAILDAIHQYQVTWVHLTPAHLEQILTFYEQQTALPLPALKGIVCTGEPLPPSLIHRFHQHLSCALHYSYSLPDMGTLTWQVLSPEPTAPPLALGSPQLPLYILDAYGQPAPVGVVGTIAVEHPLVSHYRRATPSRSLMPSSPNHQGAMLLKTQQQGRRLANGALALVGPRERCLLQDYAVGIPQVEAALLQLAEIADCCVLQRTPETGWPELVAYVVARGNLKLPALKQQLQALLPEPWIPQTLVEVTSIPVVEGQRDDARLSQLPVLDEPLVSRWEAQLTQLPAVNQAAVLIEDQHIHLPRLHLSDILADWQPLGEPAAAPVTADPLPLEGETSKAVPALSEGGPLPAPYDRDRTLTAVLQQAAEAAAPRGCVHINSAGVEQFQSYHDLRRAAQSLLKGLRQLGLQPQDQIILQLANTQDFITAFWTCTLGGFVPVPVSVPPVYEDNHSGVVKLRAIWDMLEQPRILSTAQGAAQISALDWATDALSVVDLESLAQNPPDLQVHPCQPDDIALLMLTSGSTGLSKGVPLTHRNLLSMTAGTIVANDFTPAEVTLNWMPMDHVGALVFLSIMSVDLGCQQVHVPTDYILQNPLRWLDLIDRHRATISWAPNFAFTLMCDRTAEIRQGSWDLSAMKFLVNAGEAVVVKTARNFLKLLGQHGLPSTAIHPAFGMCETCSGISWSHRFSLETTTDDDAFADLGPPIPGAALRIVNNAGEVVPEGVIGQLQLQGPSVTAGYYRRPDANREVFTADGWFTTGDLGFLHQGSLTITGRLKDIIIINGFNYYSHEIEAAVEELDGIQVSYTAACGVRDGGNTDRLAIFFHSTLQTDTDRRAQLKAIRSQVIEKIGLNPDYLIPIEKEAVPKTAIGKIQRSQLSQRFAQGEFAPLLKQVDLLTENANTLPDWFLRPTWRPGDLIRDRSLPLTGVTLVFLDPYGLGAALCDRLAQQHLSYVQVVRGDAFQLTQPHTYSLNPHQPEQYQALLQAVLEHYGPIQQMVHLWPCEETPPPSLAALEQAQYLGIYSVLALVQSLTAVQGTAQPVRLLTATLTSQQVLPGDVVAATQAPLLGILQSLSQEMPWLQGRHLDLPAATPAAVDWLWQELTVATPETFVAYRSDRRWVSCLEPVHLADLPPQPVPFQTGAFYVLTGGLGELGQVVAEYLLQRYEAKILVVGRTPLPAADAASLAPLDPEQQAKLSRFQHLVSLPGEMRYVAADVTDLAALQQAVATAAVQWQTSLAGVIHLAGVYHERAVVEESWESCRQILRPKLQGTWVLNQLMQQSPNALFIHFSSIASYFGGAFLGAYAAANRFQESFVHAQRAQGQHRSYCLSWSNWEGLGVSRQAPPGLRKLRGYYALTAQQGMHSLAAVLQRSVPHVLVGVDAGHLHIRQRLTGNSQQSLLSQQLVAYCTTVSGQPLTIDRHRLQVRDRFGTPSTCTPLTLPAMPLTASGAIDRQQLRELGWHQQAGAAEKVLPRSPLEQQIADIWQQALGLERIGVFDSFFELGGNSLIAVQLIAQLSDTFQVDIPLSRLLQTQTIADFAELLAATAAEDMATPLVPIQPHGSKPPLFFVHPVGGNVLCYQELARQLGPDQPFYGLEVVSLNRQTEPLTSVPAMAQAYLEAIRSVQPEGPYYLGGWSLGGLIAYEMAQQLKTMGATVAVVTLIDAYGANGVSLPATIDHADLLAAAIQDLGGLAGKSIELSAAELRGLSHPQQLQRIHGLVQQAGMVPSTFTLDQFQRLWRVFQANHQAWMQYRPTAYDGSVLLFPATTPIPLAAIPLEQFWRDRLTSDLFVHPLPGDHYALLTPPVVETLAQILKATLMHSHRS